MKTIYLRMDKVDANILLELLDSHVMAGEYWGVKKHHDKRVDNLIVRLEEALGV